MSTIVSSTFSIVKPGIGILIANISALITPILITNNYLSKLKIRYSKMPDSINVISLLYEKTLKQLMLDKKIDGKEIEESK